MKTFLLLSLITFAEATIGVFVKLTDGRIPIFTLNFYALAFASLFLVIAMPLATGYLILDGFPGTSMIGGGALLIGAGLWLSYEMSKGRENRLYIHANSDSGVGCHAAFETRPVVALKSAASETN